MIPPLVSHEVSRGEREVFDRLKHGPSSGDWIVLHSLDVARHRRQVSGEIDFVVIVPGEGVLCLEVKGCARVSRDSGLWFYGSNPAPDSRGPFKQASEAMHSIRRRIVERRPELSKVVFWTAVIFPFVEFRSLSEEWHSWQIIDKRSFWHRPLDQLLNDVLGHAHKRLRSCPSASWYRPGRQEPSQEQCQIIADLLRPDFEYFEAPSARLSRLSQDVKRYTSEQLIALDSMEQNPRVMFSGPAGTGKTALAIEATRRAAAAQNRRTLFICYNTLLARFLQDVTATSSPTTKVATLHGHMLDIAGMPAPPAPSKSFWEEELPELATQKMLDAEGCSGVFDELIVDEAQDLLRDNYLDFLDLSLAGGLSSGRWKLFGDFDRQAIYLDDSRSWNEIFCRRGIAAPVCSLRVNCRNTPRIASLVRLLGGLDPDYARVLRPDDGVEWDRGFYANPRNQEELLESFLDALIRGEGFPPEDVVVLSSRADDASAAGRLASRSGRWRGRLTPYRHANRGSVRYCSIQAFKGLEAGAVIVTDVDRISGSKSDIFYIAVTRALHRVVVLADESVKREIAKMLVG